jgi:hypothetical protein
MPFQTTKNASYDNAVSLARYSVTLPVSAAGSGGTFGQYFARGNETVWSVGAIQRVAGTSTYTTTNTFISNGTSTTAVNTNTAATTVTGFRVSGTATTTAQLFVVAAANGANGAVALQNFGAFAAPVNGVAGINLVAGDLLYMTNGTDATATSFPIWEFSVTPLANVTA